MFSQIKQTATTNLHHTKKYLEEVGNLIPPPPNEPTDFHNSLKGMFFVYLYGVYEAIITSTVLKTIAALNNSQTPLSDCIVDLLPMILNNEYDALHTVSSNKKWEKRWNISQKIRDNSPISINTELVPTDGKNYQYAQLESIVKSFGVPHNPLPRPEIGGHIREMVVNRNHIAHGDELPQDVGKRYTMTELLKRWQEIDEFCTYFVDMFENYINTSEYKKSSSPQQN